MKKQKEPKRVRLTFRLPADLARQVNELRITERRSLNTQLVILVEKGLTA